MCFDDEIGNQEGRLKVQAEVELKIFFPIKRYGERVDGFCSAMSLVLVLVVR